MYLFIGYFRISSLTCLCLANSIPRGVTCSMYVDDLLVCYSGKNMATIERQLKLCLNKIHNWSVANGFKFSKSKTVCMHFCHLRTVHPDPSLTMDGDPMKVVKETRFLGLVFDTKLSFLPHGWLACLGWHGELTVRPSQLRAFLLTFLVDEKGYPPPGSAPDIVGVRYWVWRVRTCKINQYGLLRYMSSFKTRGVAFCRSDEAYVRIISVCWCTRPRPT